MKIYSKMSSFDDGYGVYWTVLIPFWVVVRLKDPLFTSMLLYEAYQYWISVLLSYNGSRTQPWRSVSGVLWFGKQRVQNYP